MLARFEATTWTRPSSSKTDPYSVKHISSAQGEGGVHLRMQFTVHYVNQRADVDAVQRHHGVSMKHVSQYWWSLLRIASFEVGVR